MVWTYLFDTKNLKQLTLEKINIEPNDLVELDKLKNGYLEMTKEGFFDGFKPDYNELFISSFKPNESPKYKEKIFVLEF